MQTLTRTLYLSGLGALGGVTLFTKLGITTQAPFVGPLVGYGGVVGALATVVLTFAIGVLFTLTFQFERLGRQSGYIQQAKTAARSPDGLKRQFFERLPKDSMIRQRFELLQHPGPGKDKDMAGFVLSAQSAMEAGKTENAYSPLRAVVWSLPALGFLGTAAEMATAVRDLGGAVGQGSDYQHLSDSLVHGVIPSLAEAFNITLFALGASVACHLLISFIHSREQQLLVEADAIGLEWLATSGPISSNVSHTSVELTGDVNELTRQVAGWRQDMTHSRNGTGHSTQQIATALASMSGQLEQIRADLDRDLITKRAPRPAVLTSNHR